MDEKKLLDQIRQSASELTPPESLNPDAIEKLLTPEKHAKKKIFTLYRLAGTAAVFVLCAVSLWQVQKIQRHSASLERQMTEKVVSQEAGGGNSSANIQETPAASSESSSADSSENISALPAAQSYEEIYSALREEFYYEEDDEDSYTNTEESLGSALKSWVSSKLLDSLTEPIGGGAVEPIMSAAIAVEDGAAENSMDMGTGASSAEISEPAGEEIAVEDAVSVDEAPLYADSQSPAQEESKQKTSDYSKTNIQEFGVDEADIVKTDGRYIYILRRDGSVTIVDAKDPRALKETSTTPPADSDLLNTEELYVDGDILNVIASRQSTSLEQDGDVYYPSSTLQTVLYTYDISDRAAPKLSGTAIQDGSYKTSRKNGSFIYLFTSWYPSLGATYQESRIIPTINGMDLKASDFYIPESLTSPSYLLISSVNTEDPQNILDRKALVSGTSNFYVSPENIYIANENWNSSRTTTDIMKFHYEDGMITGTAAGNVKGYLNNSFSLNEYNGSLRVVSTYYDDSGDEQNGLYIFDKTLHITGSIENLAEGETIRSARFFGDIGYFVTFRQTDPLFSVDLSDPAAPVILGALKVSGFSSYLHFYGKDLLLGMGYEADEQTGVTSGVKLSMFDVSDPANVTELHRLVIPGVTWCPSIDNYKTILIDPQKNIFGFFCDDRYLVFSYDKEKGFVSELTYDFIQDSLWEQTSVNEDLSEDASQSDLDEGFSEDTAQSDLDENFLEDTALSVPVFDITTSDSSYYSSISADNTRGLYIGDTFYLAGDVSVIALDMADNYSRLGRLQL